MPRAVALSLTDASRSVLTENQTYGAGVGSGARLTASKCKFSRNQVGLVSKGTDSVAQLVDCEVRHKLSISKLWLLQVADS
jgi:hypothetical protein